MEVRILEGLPPYGPPAVCFPKPDAFREGLVVEFTRDDGSQWVGNFDFDHYSREASIHRELGPRALVVKAGTCGYVVDVEGQRLVREFAAIEQLWFVSSMSMFVASTGCELEAFDAGGLRWRSRRFAFDGISVLEISDVSITGRVWVPSDQPRDDKFVDYRACLATGEVEGGVDFRRFR